MNSLSNTALQLKNDYPQITFLSGDSFLWSPKEKSVTYKDTSEESESPVWSLLHEVSHGILDHQDYDSDFELIKLETEAWQHAIKLGKSYNIDIDHEYVQDCLDTYRDWLHQRSTCPNCQNISTQQKSNNYRCFNCGSTWAVSKSRFCRPYRMTTSPK